VVSQTVLTEMAPSMTTVTILGTANFARVEGWLTYEMREWWNSVGKGLYPNITLQSDTENVFPDFYLMWNWTADEVYIGIKDYRYFTEDGLAVFTHAEYSNHQPDVKAFQKAIDFIHRWATGQTVEKEFSFMLLEWVSVGKESEAAT